MDSASTTLVFTFYAGMRLQSKAAMGIAISRLIEERVGLAEGMEDVRKWLIIISRASIRACNFVLTRMRCCMHCGQSAESLLLLIC